MYRIAVDVHHARRVHMQVMVQYVLAALEGVEVPAIATGVRCISNSDKNAAYQ